MVELKQTMGGYEVLVNDKRFGYISQEHGYFTDPTVVKDFIEVSHWDLHFLAECSMHIKKTGHPYHYSNLALAGLQRSCPLIEK